MLLVSQKLNKKHSFFLDLALHCLLEIYVAYYAHSISQRSVTICQRVATLSHRVGAQSLPEVPTIAYSVLIA